MAEGLVSRRVEALSKQLSPPSPALGNGLQMLPTAATAGRSLPRFDVGVMEAYLDDLRGMKLDVYELLRQHPELLPPVLEGMTKGADPPFSFHFESAALRGASSPVDLESCPNQRLYASACSRNGHRLSLQANSGSL